MSVKLKFTPKVFNQMSAAAEACCSISSKSIPFQTIVVKDLGIVFQIQDKNYGRSLFRSTFEVPIFESFEWSLMSDQLHLELLFAEVFPKVNKNSTIEWEFIPEAETIKVCLKELNDKNMVIRNNEFSVEKTIIQFKNKPKYEFESGTDVKVNTDHFLSELKVFKDNLKTTDIKFSYKSGFLNIIALSDNRMLESNLEIIEEIENSDVQLAVDVDLLIKLLTRLKSKLRPKSKLTRLRFSKNTKKEVGFIFENEEKYCQFIYMTSRKYDN